MTGWYSKESSKYFEEIDSSREVQGILKLCLDTQALREAHNIKWRPWRWRKGSETIKRVRGIKVWFQDKLVWIQVKMEIVRNMTCIQKRLRRRLKNNHASLTARAKSNYKVNQRWTHGITKTMKVFQFVINNMQIKDLIGWTWGSVNERIYRYCTCMNACEGV